jgi:plastocyanin
MMPISFPRRLAAVAVFVLLLGTGAAAAAPQPVTIRIDNFTFTPAELSVPVGTTVTWVNGDDIPHTVVAVDKSFRSKALDTGDSYSQTLSTPGTVAYFCGLHPHMTGRITVTP